MIWNNGRRLNHTGASHTKSHLLSINVALHAQIVCGRQFSMVLSIHYGCNKSQSKFSTFLNLWWRLTNISLDDHDNFIGHPTEGPIKLPLYNCLSVRPSVRCFSQKWLISFFWFLARWYFSRKINFCPNLGKKG